MRDSWSVEGCQVEQMGGDRALPEETNYQHFVSKTNILQPNHILQSSLHCPRGAYIVFHELLPCIFFFFLALRFVPDHTLVTVVVSH